MNPFDLFEFLKMNSMFKFKFPSFRNNQDLFEMKEYFIFLGIYLLIRQYLEAMIDASQGSGEQENHNSALLLGMNCQVL